MDIAIGLVILAVFAAVVLLPLSAAAWVIYRIASALLLPSAARSGPPIVENERHAVAMIAPRLFPGCQIEATLSDGSRVDILTTTHAIEADWPHKIECIAQSLWYARMTGRKPGILLLLTGRKSDARNARKIQNIAAGSGIDVWTAKVKKSG